jgi:hypothetical protein
MDASPVIVRLGGAPDDRGRRGDYDRAGGTLRSRCRVGRPLLAPAAVSGARA